MAVVALTEMYCIVIVMNAKRKRNFITSTIKNFALIASKKGSKRSKKANIKNKAEGGGLIPPHKIHKRNGKDMKVLKSITPILALIGFLIIFAMVSSVDYEDETRMDQDERMTTSEFALGASCGLIMMIAGGVGYAIADNAELEKSGFERRKSKYRYK